MSRPSIYLANVGANSSHRFISPLFDDGRFEFITIPEQPLEPGPNSVRYRDLKSHYDPSRSLAQWLPERALDDATHFDPEFVTNTYGDNCDRAPRAAALKAMQPGDLIFFLARLANWNGGNFSGQYGFYLIGFLEIENILRSAYRPPDDDALARFAANAHVRRAMNDRRNWDGFWVFAGTDRSQRFNYAVPVDRTFADTVLRTATGDRYAWPAGRTELQVIGSYTRACRRIIAPADAGGAERTAALRQAVEQVNPGALAPIL